MEKEHPLVIFDLDGVLVDTKELHYIALNRAIEEIAGSEYKISHSEHLSTYDGLPTKTKLEMLTKIKGLLDTTHKKISDLKKKYTRDLLKEQIFPEPRLTEIFQWLNDNKCSVAIASNAIKETVEICINRLEIKNLVHFYMSNEDVNNQKPHPEIYWRSMIIDKQVPQKTLIIEDSAIGRQAAYASGAHVWGLNNMKDLTLNNMKDRLEKMINSQSKNTRSNIWVDDEMIVLIPMAGAGSRFADVGYTFPKPLIEIKGKPMIQVVAENLGIKAKFVYIVQKSHYEKYNLNSVLNLITPGCEIIQTEGLTEGAACTTLLAKDFINNDKRLIIANSDQFIEWNPSNTLYSLIESGVDGGILTFKSTHPKWSFAKTDDRGFVSEVAEKNPISDNATVGVYYWKNGSDYVKYAEDMIKKNKRVNNEFYVCPVYNEAIADDKKIAIRQIENMWGIGDPDSLNYFLNNYDGEI